MKKLLTCVLSLCLILNFILNISNLFAVKTKALSKNYLSEYKSSDILISPTVTQNQKETDKKDNGKNEKAEKTGKAEKNEETDKAIQNETELNINAKSVILLEPNTSTVLYEKNSDEQLAPASITKIMSLILFMEAIDNGYFNLSTKITASEHACSMGGSQIWLEPNETMTVDELLRATVIASANDATVALAEAVSGSEEGFVTKMNEKAKALGLKNTCFKNASGLDAEGHYSSARDVALMSAELIKHPLIKKYSTVWMDALRDGKSELVNTNKLVRYYDGCTGLKTGTTGTAGHCLSATAERNGLSLIAVVMGGTTSKDRFSGASKMLDYGFANYSFIKVDANSSLLKPIKTENGLKNYTAVKAECSKSILLKKGEKADIAQTAELPNTLTAPIKKDDTIGKIHLTLKDKEIGVILVKAAEDVEKVNFLISFMLIFKSIITP